MVNVERENRENKEIDAKTERGAASRALVEQSSPPWRALRNSSS